MVGYRVKKRGIQTVNKTFCLSVSALRKLDSLSKRCRNNSHAISSLIERCIDDEGNMISGNTSPNVIELLFDKDGQINPVTWGELSDEQIVQVGEAASSISSRRKLVKQKEIESDHTDFTPEQTTQT